MATKKVILDGNVIIDLSDTTAVESDVAQGKKFYKSNGDAAYGTAVSGQGGSVDGYYISNVENEGYFFNIDEFSEVPSLENNYNFTVGGSSVSSLLEHTNDIVNYEDKMKVHCNYEKKQIIINNDYWFPIQADFKDFGFFKEGIESIYPIINAVKFYSTNGEEVSYDSKKSYNMRIGFDEAATTEYSAYCRTLVGDLHPKEEKPFSLAAQAYDIILTEVEETPVTPPLPPPPPQHTHTWGEWEVVAEPTETEEGIEKRTCTTCGGEEFRYPSALGHTWMEVPGVSGDDTQGTVGYSLSQCGNCMKTKIEINAVEGTFGEGSSIKSGTQEGFLLLNGNGNSISYKFVLPEAKKYKLYQYGYGEFLRSGSIQYYDQLYGYNPNNENKGNFTVTVNGVEVENPYVSLSNAEVVGGTELGRTPETSVLIPIGDVYLPAGENILTYTRIGSFNYTISKLVFIEE